MTPVLIVDDEPDMLWALSQMLVHAGYAVTTALNADEALHCLRQQVFALAIIDAKLPDMDGLHLAALLKEITPDLAIVLISGYYYAEDPEIAREVDQKAVMSFISKPFSVQEIRSTLQRLLTNA